MRSVPLLVTVAGAIAVAALAGGVARADNGPHGGYGAIPDECAACHRVHTAASEELLVYPLPDMCFTCHNGSGADTDVVDGLFVGDSRGLKAGGFVYASMDTDMDGEGPSLPVTSTHIHDGSTGTAWGNGAIGSGPGLGAFAMKCTTCHNPHGNAGTSGTATYRILRPIPTGSGAASGVDVPDQATKTYGVSDPNNAYFAQAYGAERDPLSSWCAQCHTRYDAPSGSASTPSGDLIFAYRHITRGSADCQLCHPVHGGSFIPPNPWDVPSDIVHAVRCETCHVAHGTTASMGPASRAVEWPDESMSSTDDERSSLLRIDNRGLCIRCHPR